jgi:predicted phosphodiesterase
MFGLLKHMRENMMLPEKVKKEMEKYIKANPDSSHRDIAAEFDISPSTAGYYKKLYLADEADALELDAVKKATEIQRLRDVQRIERGTFRKEARVLNSANALFDELLERVGELHTHDVAPPVAHVSGGTLIVQFSDCHISQTVALPNNIVNTEVINQRLFKFVDESIRVGQMFGVRRCVVLFTGDLLSSDRRIESELINNEMSRAQAVIIAFEIFSQAIDRLSHYFTVTDVVSVAANECRLRDFFAFEASSMINGFGYIIDRMLKVYFPKIKFASWGNPNERVVKVDGVSILITHGIAKARATPEAQLAYYRGKYGPIDFMMSGHLHESLVGPRFSRSGSPIGKNAYSEMALGIVNSNPSQTCYVVEGGFVKAFPIPLDGAYRDGAIFKTSPIQQAKDYAEVVVDLAEEKV